MNGADRTRQLVESARRSPATVDVEAVCASLTDSSRAAQGRAATALGLLALAGRDVSPGLEGIQRLQRDVELLSEPARLTVEAGPEGEVFQPRAVAFAVASLAVTGELDPSEAVPELVAAHERRYPEFDPDAAAYTAFREVGWALASVVILADGHVERLAELTASESDTLRRAGAAALANIAEEYPPIRGHYPDETPRLVSLAADRLASDSHRRVRYHAAFALYEFGQGRPDLVRETDALRDALDDEYALVRTEAAGALGVVDATDAVSALRDRAVADSDSQVREAAADAVEALTRAR
ncbi:HEAT repeat domain-containing protein [Halobellus sp. GM3]|uniref:HEAT repeat domain-containing protein n=1 Tax=Halobellus sp. GM3 TaxID=3458410 RepID=UPI00403E176F